MHVALTVWDDRLATVADFAQRAELVSLAAGRIAARQHLGPPPATGIAAWCADLRARGATTLLCGAISCRLRRHLAACGIAVADGRQGPVQAALTAWLAESAAAAPTAPSSCRRPCRRRRRAGAARGA